MDDREKDLWITIYESVIHGLYLHDKWNGIEDRKAREVANRSVELYREECKNG